MAQEDKDKIIPSARYIGKFDYHTLIRDVQKEIGDVANTENALYQWSGQKWILIKINNVSYFKVKDRGYVQGRGYYTTIDNEEGIPITLESTIRRGLDSLDIKGIEKNIGATGVLSSWNVITKEKTEGDIITIDIDGERTLNKIFKR